MNTAEALRSRTVKELAKLAARLGIDDWRTMSKERLVRAVARKSTTKPKSAKAATRGRKLSGKLAASKKARKKSEPAKIPARNRAAKKPAAKKASLAKPVIKSSSAKARVAKRRRAISPPKKTAHSAGHAKKPVRAKTARVVARIQRANADRERQKNLATPPSGARGNGTNGSIKRISETVSRAKHDRVVLLVRDAYWLQAVWELSRQSVERAQAAMAEQWHTAQPTLRLIEADGGATTSTAERVTREIEIHGGVTTWYIDVPGLSKSYRVDIGYLAANGKFYSLARSNTVTTPRPNNGDIVSENWSDIVEDCEKIYALSGGYSDEASSSEVQQLFEERLGRPMGTHAASRFGTGADKMLTRNRDFLFEVDAEMIVFGTTKPNARVTLAGTPIKLRPDGTFTARLSMPDRRQVLPIVASSADGVEQRTVVLAVERNTKVMEPMIRESHD